ncbi:hypothetical protein A6V37_26220 [Paraburkholderia ginsengiterrae]|uniref:Uncharacterized protein n=1 Tax=Paraburkholderia ginsengiterrae TaxID=1462993 RepID=A0A1A9N6X7_9BURK|nr:hypothetical protein A6V37_26220 [Paraburkholderia ginsengiterrae]
MHVIEIDIGGDRSPEVVVGSEVQVEGAAILLELPAFAGTQEGKPATTGTFVVASGHQLATPRAIVERDRQSVI